MTLDRIIARIFPSRKPAPPRPLTEKDLALDLLLPGALRTTSAL
jgi:hypothetical protein